MSTKYTGFQSYVTTGKFTPEFIHDFEYWCKRIFWNWKFYDMEFDTFYEICWEALLTKINEFDPKIATIQTFCISRINNEAWRTYMKNKAKKPEVDTEDDVIKNTLSAEEKETYYEYLNDFVMYCNTQGVIVNKKELYADYIEEKDSAPMLAFAWWMAKNKEVGGRNDIQQRKRRANA